MTKKHFIVIADTLKRAFAHIEISQEDKNYIVESFGVALRNENSRFDEVKFTERVFEQDK